MIGRVGWINAGITPSRASGVRRGPGAPGDRGAPGAGSVVPARPVIYSHGVLARNCNIINGLCGVAYCRGYCCAELRGYGGRSGELPPAPGRAVCAHRGRGGATEIGDGALYIYPLWGLVETAWVPGLDLKCIRARFGKCRKKIAMTPKSVYAGKGYGPGLWRSCGVQNYGVACGRSTRDL